jgi:hypothetical protein
MTKGRIFSQVAPCPRFRARDERMIQADEFIPRGTEIHADKWLGQVTFIAR